MLFRSEFPSLPVILEHNFYFINMMLLLTADPLPPFMSLLLSLVLGLFPFPSFFHKFFLLSFSSSCHLSQNFTTHLLRSSNPSCRRQKVKALPTKRGKRSPPTIHLPRSWVKRGEEAPHSESNCFEEEEGGHCNTLTQFYN